MENGPGYEMQPMQDYSDSLNKGKYKDVLFYLNAMIKNWNLFKGLFKTNYPLCLCHDIKFFRNKWAHQSLFSSREAYRCIDQCQALLEECELDAYEIDILRKEVLEYLYRDELSKVIKSSIGSKDNDENKNIDGQVEYNYQYNDFNYNYEGSNNYQDNHNVINSNVKINHNEYMNDDDLIMEDGCEIDKRLIHDNNYNKLISGQEKQDSIYKITYYEEKEGDQ